jgi:Fe-S oxidoreductase
MKKLFAPGCALMIYKPHLADKLFRILNDHAGKTDMLLTCCKHEPKNKARVEVINICPGCDKRFRNDYERVTTISLWEILADSDFFTFPDYQGKAMSIIDACPTRNQPHIHDAIRRLLKRMNIRLIEPEKTRTEGTCCGDTFYGILTVSEVKEQMAKRTSEMPAEDVVVYCVSCSKSVFIGGKKPHYLIDLLLNEETLPKTLDPVEWHQELEVYISMH